VPLFYLATPLCSALVCFAGLSSLLVRFCFFADAVHLGAHK
jgi:hypothetical protein